MSLKEVLQEERQDLQSIKRPYETAAFIIFMLLFIQQLAWLGKALWQFIFDSTTITFLSVANWCNANNQGWIARIVTIDSTKWVWVIAGLLGYVLYWAIIYFLVWDYCKRHGYAKWTWTTLVVFLPGNLLFMPAYMWFIVYVFRPYIMRFIKRAMVEYKQFDPNHKFEEELEPAPEPEPVPLQPESD